MKNHSTKIAPECTISGATHQRGISAIELLLVSSCFCLVLAAGVPNVQELQRRWQLWGAASLLESSLAWGRMHAIAANTSLWLQVDEEGRRFCWVDSVSGEELESTIRYLPGDVRIISRPRRPLRLHPHGNAAPAGTFVLQGAAGQYQVIVNLLGRVRIQKE